MSFYVNNVRHKLVFFGTPEISAKALKIIYQRAQHAIQIVAVVSQPPVRAKRGSDLMPSPVHALALELGIPVFTPASTKDEEFLTILETLKPDLCLTAAYGQFLPKRLLAIPKFGTLNIHPSLLPLYRGASPVQRTLENGDEETGITLLFSTLAMDAGPIFIQEKFKVDENIKSSELLEKLFIRGAELFVRHYNKIFSQTMKLEAQDATKVTHAKKLSKEEGLLDFTQSAKTCHNKVRAFDIWPKTTGKFLVDNEIKEIKIISTEVVEPDPILSMPLKCVVLNNEKQAIDIYCGDNKILRIKELQEPNKRVMTAGEYINGLHGRKLVCV